MYTHTRTHHNLNTCSGPLFSLPSSRCFSLGVPITVSISGCCSFELFPPRSRRLLPAFPGYTKQVGSLPVCRRPLETGLRQWFLVYFHELLTGHPAAGDGLSVLLLWIERTSEHYCGSEHRETRERICWIPEVCAKSLVIQTKRRQFRAPSRFVLYCKPFLQILHYRCEGLEFR